METLLRIVIFLQLDYRITLQIYDLLSLFYFFNLDPDFDISLLPFLLINRLKLLREKAEAFGCLGCDFLQYFLASRPMYQNVPLSVDQICELRSEVQKLLEESIQTYQQRLSSNTGKRADKDYDTLYEFGKSEHMRHQRLLRNLSGFTFSLMTNFDLIWEEVHHRDGKLLELRDSLSSAVEAFDHLKNENDDLRSKLIEAETYIQWIEEEKEYLDAIYHQNDSTSTRASRDLQRCTSERTLPFCPRPKKNANYERLKDYVDGLREQKQALQRELFLLVKKYQSKSQQAKKAGIIIQHLIEKIGKKQDNKLSQFYLPYAAQDQDGRQDLLTQQLLQILRKNDSSINQRQSVSSLFDDQKDYHSKPILAHFQSFTRLREPMHYEEPSITIPFHKQTKSVKIGTDTFQRRSTGVQVEQGKHVPGQQIRISINLVGEQSLKQKHESIIKIIGQLNLQKKIEAKLHPPPQKKIRRQGSNAKTIDSLKAPTFNQTIFSTYQYYHKKLVASRIKRYKFDKPDQKIIYKNSRLNEQH